MDRWQKCTCQWFPRDLTLLALPGFKPYVVRRHSPVVTVWGNPQEGGHGSSEYSVDNTGEEGNDLYGLSVLADTAEFGSFSFKVDSFFGVL